MILRPHHHNPDPKAENLDAVLADMTSPVVSPGKPSSLRHYHSRTSSLQEEIRQEVGGAEVVLSLPVVSLNWEPGQDNRIALIRLSYSPVVRPLDLAEYIIGNVNTTDDQSIQHKFFVRGGANVGDDSNLKSVLASEAITLSDCYCSLVLTGAFEVKTRSLTSPREDSRLAAGLGVVRNFELKAKTLAFNSDESGVTESEAMELMFGKLTSSGIFKTARIKS
ncbi:MAG: hypothetical protein KDD62_04445 [Bdellovibrionales bacterium]|nr:hypothetical protein [Bdellovibrionales bacterium]